MSQNYYPEPSKYSPNVVEAHVSTMIDYFASVLFPYEYVVDRQKAYNRILLSDVNAGSTTALGDAYGWFKKMNKFFPFAVYNVGASTLFEEYGNVKTLNSGLIYNEELESYIYTYPAELEIQLVAFFNEALDHRKAYAKVLLDKAAYTQLISTIMIEDKPFDVTLRVNSEVDKGDLAFELEQYLVQNRIWNFNVTYRVLYGEFVLIEPNFLNTNNAWYQSPRNVDRKTVGISESIETSINTGFESNLTLGFKLDTFISPLGLIVESVLPINETTNFSRTGIVEINFNKAIKPDTVKNGIIIKPFVELDIFYNLDYTTINLQAWNPLGFSPNTTYTITINTELKDLDDLSLENVYVFNFTTN